jgi:hypothetical protein
MGYGGGGGGGGSGGGGSGSGGSGGSGASGGSGYRRVGDDRTANLFVDNITNRDGSGGTEVSGIVEINSTSHFIPPSGTTAERGSRGRAVFTGGYRDSPTSKFIDYVTIATLGNAINFGSLTNSMWAAGLSSSTRGIFGGSIHASLGTHIEYFTISATGNAFDFGDLSGNRRGLGGCSNQTRGVFMGGFTPVITEIMEYVTIASTGNVTDFGNLIEPSGDGGSFASSTRGIFFSAKTPSATAFVNTIEYITIATTGNSQDFGDQIQSKNNEGTGCSNSVRGLAALANNSDLGSGSSGQTNIIDYITIASFGDAQDFGDLTQKRYDGGATASQTRALFIGGTLTPAKTNHIDYVTIASTGNAADFGDLIGAGSRNDGLSDSHGGLG